MYMCRNIYMYVHIYIHIYNFKKSNINMKYLHIE